ncbi:fatty acid synthase [Heterostelium album PN500]|uniref:Fatty acid synthase n=1 Tax=Heterostelium pallidum (strain ATCC 26659 / Pp 5 / PN500) TaxID=670386 RepID=D3B965_HETP5|nr:fatty acid synthase [Heterostelium album PN500]EFA82104.1 fatty acid synthase [Heterostelium album PN500]|eukprot:XP_020434221.1 fatty acid synthase [Heterostelium album PN500]
MLPINNQRYIIPFTSNSESAFDEYLELLKKDQQLKSIEDLSLFQSTTSEQINRKYNYRRVIVARDWTDLYQPNYQVQSELPSIATDGTDDEQEKNVLKKKIIMIVCGQSGIFLQLGLQLYDQFPVYRDTVDHVNQLYLTISGFNVMEKILELCQLPPDSKEGYSQLLVNPLLFIFQIGMIHLFRHFGIEPDMVFGLSLGEIALFYLSGSVTLETAVKILYYRSIYQNEALTTYGGKMLNVRINYHTYLEKYASRYPELDIATKASGITVLAGQHDHLFTPLMLEFERDGVECFFLAIVGTVHSRAQKLVKHKVLDSLAGLEMESVAAKIPWYSTVSGDRYDRPIDAKYIYHNMRKPVEVEAALQSIARDIKDRFQDYVFLEISGNANILSMIKPTLPKAIVVASIKKRHDEVLHFLYSLGILFCHGFDVSFKSQFHEDQIKQHNLTTHTTNKFNEILKLIHLDQQSNINIDQFKIISKFIDK